MLHEVQFPSYNERDTVYGWIYVPACEPEGIVQLIHGYGEHSRRYLHMIVKFMDAGFIVAADDHVGHGKTAMENNDTWGDWGDKGCHTMMEDEHSLKMLVQEKYPDLPYFLYGHSMGSFIARDFIAKYGEELAGVTLCGTSGEFPHLEESMEAMKQAIDEGKGDESDPQFTTMLMGWMFDRVPYEVGNEWICDDPYVRKDHAEDPFDAFTKPTKNKSLYDFADMIKVITGPEWAEKVPDDLPIYIISGDRDPVGEYGEGVYQVSNWLISTGHVDVTTKLYSGYLHEIHNYADIKDEVEDGIVAFMDACLVKEELE